MNVQEKIPVIFIGGASRSGSTLLDRLLGTLPDFLSTGELRRLWDRGIERNELCGCEKPLRSCDFWSEVLRKAYGNIKSRDITRIRGARGKVERMVHLPELLSPGIRTSGFRNRLELHADNVTRLYRAIQEVSRCRFIIDSSKNPLHGFGLLATPGIDLRVIHLVRDSRAVAYSHQRVRPKPEITWSEDFMLQRAPLETARKWIRQNALMHPFAISSNCTYIRVRYEDLAADPGPTLNRILSNIGERVQDFDFLRDRAVRLGPSHTVSGNPMRFLDGTIEIRSDSEWQQRMDPRQKRAVTLVTLPLLAPYGYLPMRTRSTPIHMDDRQPSQ